MEPRRHGWNLRPSPLRPGPGRDPVDAAAFQAAVTELTYPAGIDPDDLLITVL